MMIGRGKDEARRTRRQGQQRPWRQILTDLKGSGRTACGRQGRGWRSRCRCCRQVALAPSTSVTAMTPPARRRHLLTPIGVPGRHCPRRCVPLPPTDYSNAWTAIESESMHSMRNVHLHESISTQCKPKYAWTV